MTDLIKRADAIEAVRKKLQDWGGYAFEDYRRGLYEAQDILEALPSAELPKGELISRADAIEAVRGLSVLVDDKDFSYFENALKKVPSAEAESDDLIIKGAKGIKDGLYNIKDGKLFKYKANGGTVRTYPIVPSADAVHGEWLEIEDYNGDYHYQCSVCKDEFYLEYGTPKENGYAYCPSCGARMKGGDDK